MVPTVRDTVEEIMKSTSRNGKMMNVAGGKIKGEEHMGMMSKPAVTPTMTNQLQM